MHNANLLSKLQAMATAVDLAKSLAAATKAIGSGEANLDGAAVALLAAIPGAESGAFHYDDGYSIDWVHVSVDDVLLKASGSKRPTRGDELEAATRRWKTLNPRS